MRLPHIATILICASGIAADPRKQDDLGAIVPQLRSSEELVRKDIHPAEYLKTLQVNSPKVPLSRMQRYGLARLLLDCYHLCDALHHQSFDIPKTAPIMILADQSFPGFREECLTESGYNTHLFFKYFEKHADVWSP
jgi:hypothetical protein